MAGSCITVCVIDYLNYVQVQDSIFSKLHFGETINRVLLEEASQKEQAPLNKTEVARIWASACGEDINRTKSKRGTKECSAVSNKVSWIGLGVQLKAFPKSWAMLKDFASHEATRSIIGQKLIKAVVCIK